MTKIKLFDILESMVWVFLFLLTIIASYVTMMFLCGLLFGLDIETCRWIANAGTTLLVVGSFIKAFIKVCVENRE